MSQMILWSLDIETPSKTERRSLRSEPSPNRLFWASMSCKLGETMAAGSAADGATRRGRARRRYPFSSSPSTS